MRETLIPRRRDYGEGSIRQRADGRHEGRLRVNGQRISVYGRSRRQVSLKLADERRKLDAGLIRVSRETVGSFLEKWLRDVVQPTTEKTTHLSYRQQVGHLDALARIPLDKLTPQQIQAVLNRKRAEGLSVRTVEYIRAVLRGALNVAVRWRQLSWNPAALVEVEHPRRGPKMHFTARESIRLLETTRGDREHPIYVVALTLGMRQGEVLGLRWPDVDLQAGELQVRTALKRAEGEVWLGTPKTEESRATLPLTPLAIAALTEWRARQRRDRFQAGPPFKDLTFTTPHGQPVTAHNLIQRAYYPALERAGLPRLPFRNLRHSCATLLRALEVDITVIQAILRHSRISTTSDYYVEIQLPAMREALGQLDRLLQGRG